MDQFQFDVRDTMCYQAYGGHNREFNPDVSLVLVGVHGSGKRSLGSVAAATLKRHFITEDHYFKEVTGLTRHEYLQQMGSQEFQHRDIEVLKMMLDNNRSRCVIECGLGDANPSSYDSPFVLMGTPLEFRYRTQTILIRFSDLLDDAINITELESWARSLNFAWTGGAPT